MPIIVDEVMDKKEIEDSPVFTVCGTEPEEQGAWRARLWRAERGI